MSFLDWDPDDPLLRDDAHADREGVLDAGDVWPSDANEVLDEMGEYGFYPTVEQLGDPELFTRWRNGWRPLPHPNDD